MLGSTAHALDGNDSLRLELAGGVEVEDGSTRVRTVSSRSVE